MPRGWNLIAFPYKLIRSRRRTLSVTVADGEVTVRAPLRMSEGTVRRFLESKRAWIERHIARRDPSFDAVRGSFAILCGGEQYPVRFGAAQNGEKDGAFYFKDAASVRAYFIRTRGAQLLEEAELLAAQFGRMPAHILLRDFKARWGSCDANGTVKLNWRLLMLPPQLRRYVILHELCHMKFLDHSAAFWAELERCLPGCRALRKELRRYAFLPSLYRRGS